MKRSNITILTSDQSVAGSVGIFSRRTNQSLLFIRSLTMMPMVTCMESALKVRASCTHPLGKYSTSPSPRKRSMVGFPASAARGFTRCWGVGSRTMCES